MLHFLETHGQVHRRHYNADHAFFGSEPLHGNVVLFLRQPVRHQLQAFGHDLPYVPVERLVPGTGAWPGLDVGDVSP